MVLLHLLTGHLLLLLVVDQVTSQSAPPPNTTSCYSNSCGDDPTIPWCVQTCPSNLTKCLALYSTDLLTGVATPISFRCAYSPAGGCMSWSCDPASISEVGVSSCCCTGKLCNYVSMVMTTPLPGEDTPVCETFTCTDANHCSHGYIPCLGTQSHNGTCQAVYKKNTKGKYTLTSKQCADPSSSPSLCAEGQCVVNTGSGNDTVSCCCHGDKCNVNVTFTQPAQVLAYVPLLSYCGSVGTMYILNGNPGCVCPPGYLLGADKWTCLDINECSLNNGGCSDGCVNTLGSFMCTCRNDLGYFLAPDGHTCIASLKCSMYNCQTTPTSPCDFTQVQYCLPLVASEGTYTEDSLKTQHCTSVYFLGANGTLLPSTGGCFIGAPGPGPVCMLQSTHRYEQYYVCLCTGDLCNSPQSITAPNVTNMTVPSVSPSSSIQQQLVHTSGPSPPPQYTYASQANNLYRNVAIGTTLGAGMLIIWTALVVVATYKCCQRGRAADLRKGLLPSSSPVPSEVDPPWGPTQHTSEKWLESKSEQDYLVGEVPHRLEVIGCGQFAKVFKARVKNYTVAVKVFDGGKRGREYWTRETEIYKTVMLKHENIVTFISSGCSDSELWFVMEYYPNGSLYDFLKTHILDLPSLCDLAISASCGLAHLHSEIVINGVTVKPSIAHRDLKSKNVLVKHDGTCSIGDFGLAMTFRSGEIIGDRNGDNQGQVGTSRYMAPEILEGCVNFGMEDCLKIDIYAFALVLWEMASRTDTHGDGSFPVEDYHPPFYSYAPVNPTIEQMKELVIERNLRPQIPPGINELHGFVPILQDSWEGDVMARLTASSIEMRLRAFRSSHVSRPSSSQSKDSGLAESRQSPLGTALNGHASSSSAHLGPPCNHCIRQAGGSNEYHLCHMCDSPSSLHKGAGSMGTFQQCDNRLANSGSLTETTV